jgi:hypothetical protein
MSTIDSDPCYEIAARLTGAISLMSDYDGIDASDDLQYARRLLHDALAITNRYSEEVDRYTTAVRHAEHVREQGVGA